MNTAVAKAKNMTNSFYKKVQQLRREHVKDGLIGIVAAGGVLAIVLIVVVWKKINSKKKYNEQKDEENEGGGIAIKREFPSIEFKLNSP